MTLGQTAVRALQSLSIAAALGLVAMACGEAGDERSLTAPSTPIGGPGGEFALCDGPICALTGEAFAAWEGRPLKMGWRVEEAHAGETLSVRGRSADGSETFAEERLARATSLDDLPGYHYFASVLPFTSTGVWTLEVETGDTRGTIVVDVERAGS